MKESKEGVLLRVFVSENARIKGRPVYERIVEEAFKRGLAGATVLRGLMGFGAHHRMHTAKILRLSEGLPVIVEIVDTPERIDEFLPFLNETIDKGYVTTEKVNVIVYRPGAKDNAADNGA